MKGNLFILCLLFLLLKVGLPVPVQGSALAEPVLHPGLIDASVSAASLPGSQSATTVQAGSGTSQQPGVFDDAEDDETNEQFSRKFKLIARSYPLFILETAPVSSLHRASRTAYLPGNVSDKYLLLRVLRV